MYDTIEKCRICGNSNLKTIINLGEQAYTGVFPSSSTTVVQTMPLQLVKCHAPEEYDSVCGLVQLKHTGNLGDFYGDNYGYRSGLNDSMVRHLKSLVEQVKASIDLQPGDCVLDIGSNDSTLLKAYNNSSLERIGVDPAGDKFRQYYPSDIQLISKFFTKINFDNRTSSKARVVTSISMLYDLEDPLFFMREVRSTIADDGLWVMEQSYLPTMIKMNSYDTVCHEHLEYYSLRQIQWMADRSDFKILDVHFNNTNGGSFQVWLSPKGSHLNPTGNYISEIHAKESVLFANFSEFENFRERVEQHREKLRTLLNEINASGHTVFGYGASTKGNVLLQYCDFSESDIPFIAEVNEDKFGSFTPGTKIPIVSEYDAKEKDPSYMLVLPWHFRENILRREKLYLERGGKFIFPLPEIDVVGL